MTTSGRRLIFVFRGSATDLLRLLATSRHPAGKGLRR